MIVKYKTFDDLNSLKVLVKKNSAIVKTKAAFALRFNITVVIIVT